LKPGSLIPPRDLNPRLSGRTERAILAAMAQHPDDRPASVDQFRDLLFPNGAALLSSANNPVLSVPVVIAWREALSTYRLLLAVTLLLTVIALLVTIWAPLLPH
jgi:serine/threonine-protein kinase